MEIKKIMNHPTLSIHDSLRELLSSARQSDDCTMLLPVIESIFEQIDEIDSSVELTYRSMIKQLAQLFLDSSLLSEQGRRQFDWLVKLSESGHDANVMEAMINQLNTDIFTYAPMVAEQQDNALPEQAIKELTEQADSIGEKNNEEPEPAQLPEFIQSLTASVQAEPAVTDSSENTEINTDIDQLNEQVKSLNHELSLVKQLSLTDDLTRLPNKRAFLKRLKDEIGRLQRFGYPLSIAFLSLDMLDEMVTAYGPAVGDEILQFYTSTLLKTFRNYDFVARYGNEEFAVLLPHTSLEDAEKSVNKVLQRAAETRMNASIDNSGIHLPTFSAGVALYKTGESIDTTINRAVSAMKSAKSLGQNRVVIEGA